MLTIYSPSVSPRLQYIVTELFCTMQGIEAETTSDVLILTSRSMTSPCICYAPTPIDKNALWIKPCGLLSETGIKNHELSVKKTADYFTLFSNTDSGSWPFDLFSAAFFMLSRYEEQEGKTPDQHGRFKAEDSIAYQYGFLEEPIVDQWMQKLLSAMKTRWPLMESSKRTFSYLKTIDVDNVFAYQHKGPLINGMHLIKDATKGNWELVKQRLRCILRLTTDPYFNLEEMSRIHQPYKESTIFFFHCGTVGSHDKKTWMPSLGYRKIRRELSKYFTIGLHPSYRSAHTPWMINIEKKILENITDQQITRCRSHYLLFRIPTDYHKIEQLGFTDDYTMGYSNNPGFRAGTSIPYHLYYIDEERPSKIMVHPLAVMDKSLHSNMHLTAEEAEQYILKLANTIKSVNGELVTLFHNENQADAEEFGWQGWKKMYERLLKEITNA